MERSVPRVPAQSGAPAMARTVSKGSRHRNPYRVRPWDRATNLAVRPEDSSYCPGRAVRSPQPSVSHSCRSCRLSMSGPSRRSVPPITGSCLMRRARDAGPSRHHNREPKEDSAADQAGDNYCSDQQVRQPSILAQARLPTISHHAHSLHLGAGRTGATGWICIYAVIVRTGPKLTKPPEHKP